MKKLILICFSILFLTSVYAVCNEGQIDINSASVEELVKIKWIGDSRAEQLIILRPFGSVNGLTKISGIGEIYLDDIIEQGLACVNGYEEEPPQEEEPEDEVVEITQETIEKYVEEEQEEFSLPLTPEVISLTPALLNKS